MKKTIKIINSTLMLIAFLFIFNWIYENLYIFKTASFEINFYNLIISIICINFFHLSQMIIWILGFKAFKIHSKFLISKLYLWNNIYNYLPNRIFHFGGTVLLGQHYGFDVKHTALVIINFQIYLLLSGILIILPSIDQIQILKDFNYLLYLVLIIGLSFPIIKKHLMPKCINLKFLEIKYWYSSIFISVLSWIIYSYGLYSLFQFLDKNFTMSFLHFSNISIISNLTGSFVFFMPAGIGALETVFINLIDYNKTGLILTSLILFRLIAIISSSLLILIFKISKIK